MTEIRRLMRAFLLLNVVIICVGAVAVGAIIAAENTKKTVGAGAVFVNAGTTVRDKYVPMQMKPRLGNCFSFQSLGNIYL